MPHDRKTYCLQVHPCIFQPGNFTGWGSERVNLPTTATGSPQDKQAEQEYSHSKQVTYNVPFFFVLKYAPVTVKMVQGH